VVQLARTGVKRNAQKGLVEKSELRIPLVRPRHTWVEVKTDIRSDRTAQLGFMWLKTCAGPCENGIKRCNFLG